MSDTVKQGMVVSISYTLNDENGDLFEYRDLPVSYLHGAGIDLFPKIEQALSGKSIGDEVSVTLSPEEGFGQRDPELQFTDSLVNVPEEYRHIGAEIEAESDKGESRAFFVTRIEDGKITFDANHPLSDQTVGFIVTVVGIRPASDEEKLRGTPDLDPSLPPMM